MTLRIIVFSFAIAMLFVTCRKEDEEIANQIPGPIGNARNGVYADGNGHSFNIQFFGNDICYWGYEKDSNVTSLEGLIPSTPFNMTVNLLFDQPSPLEYQIVCPPAGPTSHGDAWFLKYVNGNFLYSYVDISEDNQWNYVYTDVVFSKIKNITPLDVRTYLMDGLTLDYHFLTKDKITVSTIDTGNVTGTLPKEVHWVLNADTIFNTQNGCDNSQPWGNVHHVKNANNIYTYKLIFFSINRSSSIYFPHPDTLIFTGVDSSYRMTNQVHSYKGYRVK